MEAEATPTSHCSSKIQEAGVGPFPLSAGLCGGFIRSEAGLGLGLHYAWSHYGSHGHPGVLLAGGRASKCWLCLVL